MVKKLVKAAYSEVGKISPFDPSYKEFMQVSLRDSGITTTDELLRQVFINTNAAFSALLQGMRSLNSTVASGVSIAKPRATNTATSFSDKSQKPRKYKPLNEVECYVCGQKSHYVSFHREKESQNNEILAHAVIPDQPMMSNNMILVDGEVELSAMAAAQPQKPTSKTNTTILSRSEVKKPAPAGKQKVRFDQNLLENSIHHGDERGQEISEDMELEEDNEPVLQQSTVKANQGRKELPQTRVSKTGKLQELV